MSVHLQEMLRCDGVTIDVNPQDRLPTVSADQSDNITIKYHLPQAVSETPTLIGQSWEAQATCPLQVVRMCAVLYILLESGQRCMCTHTHPPNTQK